MQLFPEEGQQEQTAEEGTAGRRGSRAEEKNGSGWGGGCMGFRGPGKTQFPLYTGHNNGSCVSSQPCA